MCNQRTNNSEEENAEFKFCNENIEQIKQGLQDIGQYIKNMLNSLKRNISFDEYLKIIGDYIDLTILKIQKEESLTFISGICNFNISDNKASLEILSDLYFKNQSNQWVKKTIKGKTAVSDFDSETQKSILTKIQTEGMKLDIEPPINK